MSRSASNLKWCDECHCWHRVVHLECPYHYAYQPEQEEQ